MAATLERPTFKSTWLPLVLTGVALVILNLGLYIRLASQPMLPAYTFPYSEDFSVVTTVPYEEFGGNWEIRDETLVQMSTSGFDLTAFIPMNIAPEQAYRFEVTLRYLGGTMGGGLIFNAQQTTSRQKSHMARFNVDAGQLWLIYGYFGDDSNFVGQGSAALNIAPEDDTPHRLGVQIANTTYALYLDDVLLAADVPLQYQGGTIGFISATSQVAFDDVVVDGALGTPAEVAAATQPEASADAPFDVPTEAPINNSEGAAQLVLAEPFDTAAAAGESLWRPIGGVWEYADGALIQRQTDGFDLSTIYQRPLSYPLILRQTFWHLEGIGGGLLFNLPAADSKNGGHMVRYVNEGADVGSVIAWGAFDPDGVFNGQGSAVVSAPGSAVHTLEIQVLSDTYAIFLDGEVVASDIPLSVPQSTSYIGLTASQSAVAFDTLEVLRPAPVADAMGASIDAGAASGDWELVEGGVIVQSATEAADYVAGTGIAGERFSISVQITLPSDNPTAERTSHCCVTS